MSENLEKVLSSDSNIIILNKSLNKEDKKEVELVAQEIPAEKGVATEPKVEATIVNEAPAEVAPTEVTEAPKVDVSQVGLPTFDPVIPVDSVNALNPGFDMGAMPAYEEQVRQSEISSGEASVAPVGNDFADAYKDVSLVKVQSTVVTKEDAKEAESAFIEVIKEAYEKGPGKNMETLIMVAAKMDKLLEAVDAQGFVSGPNHEAIKDVRNEYRGLQEVDNAKNFSDNQDIPNFGGMSY